jgi:hypothetical protein
MDPDVALHLEIAAVVAMAVLIVAVVVVASGGGACEGAGSGHTADGAVHAVDDVESALGGVTVMTYGQAATGKEKEKDKEEDQRCAICLSEYGEAGDLVRVVPACGHFFHAECGIEGWLCRGGLMPLPPPRMIRPPPPPRMARPECPPMPPRRTAR